MKTLISLVSCAAVFVAGTCLNAADSSTTKALKGVTRLEVPAKVSSLVSAAAAKDKQTVALDLLNAAAAQYPSMTPSIVAAIVSAAPSASKEVEAAAKKLQPKQAAVIAVASQNAAKGSPRPPGGQPSNPREDDHPNRGNGDGDGNDHGRGHAYGHDYSRP